MSFSYVLKFLVSSVLQFEFWCCCPQATEGSIAVDARAGVMLVLARFYFKGLQHNSHLGISGIYECLLGISKAKGDYLAGGPEASAAAIQDVVEKACRVRSGRRDPSFVDGLADTVDSELLCHLKAWIGLVRRMFFYSIHVSIMN